MQKEYDVIIAGGGLAGLTLSIQLKMQNPDLSILIMEYRDTIAPTAAHKVGESTVELATHYFREVLNLKEYLEEFELPKHGLRFFFKSDNKAEISNRVELGPRLKLPTPSHQLDRGTFENFLEKHTKSLGTEFMLGARVKDVNFSASKEEGHEVIFNHNGEEQKLKARWIVDATSRFSLLKRKMKFEKEAPHNVNAVWYRVKGVVDIDEWSDNKEWKNFLAPKLRYLSTVHFMDKGYWLWVIPLGSKNTSIGIVADEDIHPFNTINTYEKAMEWVKINEPLAYTKVCPPKEELLDFRILKHFAHNSGRIYSSDRWAVTGEAGAFLDPFYSPGSDFISLNNTWLSDLILRDKAGEDITVRAEIYERTHLRWFESWLPIYQDKYKLMGNTQIMVFKIFWDWAIYWSVPCLLFTNKGFTDLKLLKELFVSENSLGRKFGDLNKRVQDMFIEWQPHEHKIFSDKYIDPLDLDYLKAFQQGLETQHDSVALLQKLRMNMNVLEQVASEMFRLVSTEVKGTPEDMKVNPYTMTLNGDIDSTSPDALAVNKEIKKEVEKMWFYRKALVNS
ncbi:MAG: monooxygenase FAD-binding protein [Bacteroidota bacterium]|jgi:flavin-dependent dehydrogenase|nr:monooxygenase FAD-binding protein [Bacteroidota bacterium]